MGFFRELGRRYDATIYEMIDNFRCQASQVVLANRVIAQNGEALTREPGRVAPAPAADVGRGLAGMEEGGGETVDWGRVSARTRRCFSSRRE